VIHRHTHPGVFFSGQSWAAQGRGYASPYAPVISFRREPGAHGEFRIGVFRSIGSRLLWACATLRAGAAADMPAGRLVPVECMDMLAGARPNPSCSLSWCLIRVLGSGSQSPIPAAPKTCLILKRISERDSWHKTKFGGLNSPPQMGSKDQTVLLTKVDFRDITAWYQRHCNGCWEHQQGVRLETLDNPGWLLTLDLIHTDLQGRTMPEVREGIAPEDHPVSPRWIHCSVTDNQFRGACDPTQVARLFQIFQQVRCSHAPQ
jgi:Immunity protein 53